MLKGEKFIFDVSWSFLSATIASFVGVVLAVFIARCLGAHDLGVYRLTFTIYGIGILLPSFGIASATIKYVAEYKEDTKRLYQVISCSIVSSLIVGVIVALVVFSLSHILSEVFKTVELRNLLKILAIIFPFAAVYQVQLGVLNGLRRMRQYAFLMIGRDITMFILIIGLLFAGYGIGGAVGGLVASVIAVCGLGFVYVKRLFKFNFTQYFQNIGRILSFGSKVFCGGVINEINYRADIIFIGYFLSATSVGYYAVAVGLSRFFWIIPQSIQKITYPTTSEYWSKGHHAELQEMIDKSMKYNTCLLLPIGLGMVFFSGDIVPLIFGKEFIHSVPPLLILLIGATIDGAMVRPVNSTLAGIGRPDFSFKIAAAGAFVNIVLNLLLIPPFGIVGAAVATTASLLIVASVNMCLIIKHAHIKIDFQWYAKLSIVVLGCFLLYGACRPFNHFMSGGTILFAFSIFLWFYFLPRADRNEFINLIRTLIGRPAQ